MDQDNVRKNLSDELDALYEKVNAFHHISRFMELIENDKSPIYVGYAHPNGKWVYVNNCFASDMGYTKKEMYDIPWINMLDPDEQENVLEDYSDKLEEDGVYTNYKTNYITKSGSKLPITWYTSSLHTGSDKLTLCVGIPE